MKASLKSLLFAASLLCSTAALAQNPYLPLWEFIPDGEPYVFEDPDNPGKYRVYVYGSHDSLIDVYCGREQVVWSAPVDNLKDWRYDGVIFVSDKDRDGNLLFPDGSGDVLYAPDITERVENGRKVYYFYPNVQSHERGTLIAKSDRPDGPFTPCNWSKDDPRRTEGVLGFDPAVFIDDDGRVYGYWGFGESWGAELDPVTMCTVKEGTEAIHNMISGQDQEGVFRFFEASSMRKIKDKYILVYSRMMPDGEFGLPKCNYNLAWAYAEHPLGPFTYGGTLIDARARDTDDEGNAICTANPYGNTHGSIVQTGKQWWVFYHRQTGTDEYSRQAMVAPISVKVQKGKGGKVFISEAEYTSEGFSTEGLDPVSKNPAGLACYLTNPQGVRQEYPRFHFTGSYIESNPRTEPLCPVVNNTDGSVVGYKYFNFRKTRGAKNLTLDLELMPLGTDGEIEILVGGPSAAKGGRTVGRIAIKADDPASMRTYSTSVNSLSKESRKKPLYFVFHSKEKGVSICNLYSLQFRAE